MSKMKLQSAMEYVLQYGWAIVILTLVAAALLALGFFNGPQITTVCTPDLGFYCSHPIYSHTTGNVILIIQQTSSSRWITANVYFVGQGSPLNSEGIPVLILNSPLNGNIIQGGLLTGTPVQVTVPVSGQTQAGTEQQGDLWIAYQTTLNGPTYYAQAATITLKSV